MLRGFFDESYKGRQAYAIGGYVGRDRDWSQVSLRWKHRRLKDRVECFHAADCEGGYAEFAQLPKDQRTALKADLIEIIDDNENLGGFGAAVLIEDFYKVRESSERAKRVLGPNPYFLCFQQLFSDVCSEMQRCGVRPGMRVAYVFEEIGEVSGRAKNLYDDFKRTNPAYAPWMGSLRYACKQKFVPLEIADNMAYETMKEILNSTFDPERPRRMAMREMKRKIRRISLWTEPHLRRLVEHGRLSQDLKK